MSHEFDKSYWERRWRETPVEVPESITARQPNPYLIQETAQLTPGSALDAGCGAGAEATWLASAGWEVTAADISHEALERAAVRAASEGVADRIRWIEADLSVWQPDRQFDLVTSHYAHPAMPQLDFYERIAGWVKSGGNLLLVGHLHAPGHSGHEHHPPEEVSVTAAAITDRLGTADWRIDTAVEADRVVTGPNGREVHLHDVVVRATRLK